MHFFTFSQCFWMALTLQNFKLGGNLEFSWYSCNILRYCSNRCIVWFFIPENCPAQANRKFPVQLYVKIQILFEPPFWICKWANHLSFLAMCYGRDNSAFRYWFRVLQKIFLKVKYVHSYWEQRFIFTWRLKCCSRWTEELLLCLVKTLNTGTNAF